jgi:hypothetical protein
MILLEAGRPLTSHPHEAVAALLRHHDGCALPSGDGGELGPAADEVPPLLRGGLWAAPRRHAGGIEAEAKLQQPGFLPQAPAPGRLVRAREARTGRLPLIAHHLVDAVSWRILRGPDLATRQPPRDGPLPRGTTPFARWAASRTLPAGRDRRGRLPAVSALGAGGPPARDGPPGTRVASTRVVTMRWRRRDAAPDVKRRPPQG